jgi:hypothetical protein
LQLQAANASCKPQKEIARCNRIIPPAVLHKIVRKKSFSLHAGTAHPNDPLRNADASSAVRRAFAARYPAFRDQFASMQDPIMHGNESQLANAIARLVLQHLEIDLAMISSAERRRLFKEQKVPARLNSSFGRLSVPEFIATANAICDRQTDSPHYPLNTWPDKVPRPDAVRDAVERMRVLSVESQTRDANKIRERNKLRSESDDPGDPDAAALTAS